MSEPITTEFFTSRGADLATAAALAADHNRQAGIHTEAEPPQVSTTGPVRLAPPKPNATPLTPPSDAQRAQAEMDQIRRDRAEGKISDHQWRKVYERKYHELAGIASSVDAYQQGSSADKSRLRNEWDTDQVEQALESSIDAGTTPPRSPSDYVMPDPVDSPEAAEVDSQFRQAMFDAAIPRELGASLAAEVSATAATLLDASDEQTESFMAAQEAALKRIWGAQSEARIAMVRSFLAEHMGRSPMLRSLLEQHPELFSSWQTVRALAQLADSRRRTGGARR